MKKMILSIVLILTCFIFLIPAYSQDKTHCPQKKKFEDTDIFKDFPGMDRSYDGPLPWDSDTRFQETIKKYNTPVRMAAYKATLPDPILAEGYNIGLAADQLAGKVVQPGEIFSQNEAIGPYTEYRGYRAGPTYAGNTITTTVGGGVCKNRFHAV